MALGAKVYEEAAKQAQTESEQNTSEENKDNVKEAEYEEK